MVVTGRVQEEYPNGSSKYCLNETLHADVEFTDEGVTTEDNDEEDGNAEVEEQRYHLGERDKIKAPACY